MRGVVKAELVPLFTSRLQHMILSELRQDDMYPTYSPTGRTHSVVGQPVCVFPGSVDWDMVKGNQWVSDDIASHPPHPAAPLRRQRWRTLNQVGQLTLCLKTVALTWTWMHPRSDGVCSEGG